MISVNLKKIIIFILLLFNYAQCLNKWHIHMDGYTNMNMIRNIMLTHGEERVHNNKEYYKFTKIYFLYHFDDMSVMNDIKNIKGISIGKYVSQQKKVHTYEYSLKDIFTSISNQPTPYYMTFSKNIKIGEHKKSKIINFLGAGIGIGVGMFFKLNKNAHFKLASNLKYYFIGQEYSTYNINFGILYTYDMLY